MIRDITLGQYYPGKSIIHRFDPRVKIIATILYIVDLFVVENFTGFLVLGIGIILTTIIARVPISYILRGLRPILLILIFTFCLNIFMQDGVVLFHIGPLKVTAEGLTTAFFMATRLILLIISSSLLTLTTKPMNLMDGTEKLLTPFERIGLPAHDIAMMMSIALRFIPTLLSEADKIMKAQQARGADFESGNIIARAKSLLPILVPLFVSAFRIAQDLAMAMEARCYNGGARRTRMHSLLFQPADWAGLIGSFVLLGVIIAMRVIWK